MGKIGDFLRRTAGWKQDSLRRIDIADELKPGRLIFADVGRHQPVQKYLDRMAWLDPVISPQPTVELRFSTCIDTLANYGRRRTEGHLDRLPPEQVSLLRRDCNLVYSGGQSFSRDEATLSVPFEERFWKAITTCTKTVVDLDYVWAWDDAEIENLRPFNEIEPADYLVSALTAAARETRAGNARAHIYIIEVLSEYFDREDVTAALLALRDAGAAVLYLRRVSSPSPTYDLPADLHMIERYPLKNEYDDEVVLITEERVVVKAPIWGSRRPEWFKNPMDSKTMPTVAEYNTGRLDEFPVKLEAE